MSAMAAVVMIVPAMIMTVPCMMMVGMAMPMMVVTAGTNVYLNGGRRRRCHGDRPRCEQCQDK
jgi:hypothetical protein